MTWLLLAFARGGAARYLSHLDTARALLRTFARAEVGLALSQGMRPKPRLSLGLPLPVGAAARCELAAAELAHDETRTEPVLLEALRDAAPEGIVPLAVELASQRVRLEPRAAVYECTVEMDAERVRAAAQTFAVAPSAVVERRAPKGVRRIDVKRYVTEVRVLPDAAPDGGARLRFVVRHRADGAARPEEVVTALTRFAVVPHGAKESEAEGACELARDREEEAGGDADMRDLVRLEVEYERRPTPPPTGAGDGRPEAAAARDWGAAAGERRAEESDARSTSPDV